MEPKTIVCIACYYKGYDFISEFHRLGNRVILITSESLQDKAWPWDAIDEVFYMSEISPSVWNSEHLVHGFSYLMRSRKIDAVIALDDYDVEKAALLRETFRIPGMGQTTHRYFRDKLAMRQKARDAGLSCPEFTAVFNDDEVKNFTEKIPAPWILKPRSEASATGIMKIQSEEELWQAVENLGDERHLFLLESFKAGDVYHVDTIFYNSEPVFSSASKYLATPLEVSHEGGIFRTRTLGKTSEESISLEKLNKDVLNSFGLKNGASHSEYIRGTDGKYYFLETSSRVGGAHIPDMVEAATGVNIWREWAKLEHSLLNNIPYKTPVSNADFGGLLIALTKERHTDTEWFNVPEVVKFLPLDYHIGIVFKSENSQKITEALDDAAKKVSEILNIIPPISSTGHNS